MGYCLNLVVTVARLNRRHRANEREVPINKYKAKACYKRESASYFKESYSHSEVHPVPTARRPLIRLSVVRLWPFVLTPLPV